MNLIYACVFYQETYIQLLNLLIDSIDKYGSINGNNTHILIFTSPNFIDKIKDSLASYNLPISYKILNLTTMMEASCCKLRIFEYENIDKYENLLYLDTDVLINGDLNILFNTQIESNKIYALLEGHIGDHLWGGQFFDFNTIDRNIHAFSAGVFYIKNSTEMKDLFFNTNDHIQKYMSSGKTAPVCLDQPFLVYNSFISNKYNNIMIKQFLENNPDKVNLDKLIYHFPGGPGDYGSKIAKMKSFYTKMNEMTRNTMLAPVSAPAPAPAPVQTSIQIFPTRNEMLLHYYNILKSLSTTPIKIIEIGVFKGEFLNYIHTNCQPSIIDAIDLFDGEMCSGNVDGNYITHYNMNRSYSELLEKYKNTSVNIIKEDSSTYLNSCDNNSYDIIYIDGDHSYNGVKKDLEAAFKAIKHNGYIMGHDYEMNMNKAHRAYDFGVKQAVDNFCIQYKQAICAKGMDGCVSFCIQISKL